MTRKRYPKSMSHQAVPPTPLGEAKAILVDCKAFLEVMDGTWRIRKAHKTKRTPWVQPSVARKMIEDLNLVQCGADGQMYTLPTQGENQ